MGRNLYNNARIVPISGGAGRLNSCLTDVFNLGRRSLSQALRSGQLAPHPVYPSPHCTITTLLTPSLLDELFEKSRTSYDPDALSGTLSVLLPLAVPPVYCQAT